MNHPTPKHPTPKAVRQKPKLPRHIRVIVTEDGAAISCTHVIACRSKDEAEALARRLMRQVIERFNIVHNLGLANKQIDAAAAEGTWFTDEGPQPFSILILSPDRVVTV